MIIDAHHHLWDPAERAYPWMDDSLAPLRRRFDDAELTAVARQAGVGGTIAVQAVGTAEETRFLLGSPPPVVAVVGWVELSAPDVADQLAELVAAARGPRLAGIRHQAHDEPDPAWLARPDVVGGVRAVSQAGLVFDLLVREREHEAALTLVDALPEARFVLDHAGKPDVAHDSDAVARAWRKRMRDFAARPNVACKISGLFTEAGPRWRERPVARYQREAVELFGPERAIFGSDWPVSTLATGYAEIVNSTLTALSDLSASERAAVESGTAIRVYGLDHIVARVEPHG